VLVTGTSGNVIPVDRYLSGRPGYKIFNALEPLSRSHDHAGCDFLASSDAILSCKLIDYRVRFAVCREELPEPRTLEMPRPATRAGH